MSGGPRRSAVNELQRNLYRNYSDVNELQPLTRGRWAHRAERRGPPDRGVFVPDAQRGCRARPLRSRVASETLSLKTMQLQTPSW